MLVIECISAVSNISSACELLLEVFIVNPPYTIARKSRLIRNGGIHRFIGHRWFQCDRGFLVTIFGPNSTSQHARRAVLSILGHRSQLLKD